MAFQRPEISSYPNVFTTFKVKVAGSDEEEEFYIRDLTENEFDAATEFITQNHALGAVFHNACKTMATDVEATKVRDSYHKVFEQKISLICLKKGNGKSPDEMVGVNALYVTSKDDVPKPKETEFESFKKLGRAIDFISESFDVMGNYKVNKVMYAAGLCVSPDFRGRGIATEILKARIPLMKAIGLEVTSSIFSTVGAQKAAKSAGYDVNFSIAYEEFQNKFPDLDFSRAFGSSCKVLSKKI